jgi:hypothetical protein
MNQRLLEAVYSEPAIRDILRRKQVAFVDEWSQFPPGSEKVS